MNRQELAAAIVEARKNVELAQQVLARLPVRIICGNDKCRYGVITGSSGFRIRVRLDGERKSKLFHPTWNIEYISS